jgi:hypothetical protein
VDSPGVVTRLGSLASAVTAGSRRRFWLKVGLTGSPTSDPLSGQLPCRLPGQPRGRRDCARTSMMRPMLIEPAKTEPSSMYQSPDRASAPGRPLTFAP